MGLLNKLFSSTKLEIFSKGTPESFVDCLSVVRRWSIQAEIDPDMDLNDEKLKSAMNTVVTCPYCSSEILFGEAVVAQGAKLSVRCPICHTEPSNVRMENEYL